jgi:precorrin-6B methylase 2
MAKAVFEMELGGDTYRPALDTNAGIAIRRETGKPPDALLEVLRDPDTDGVARVDALRTLLWAMLSTDCGKRNKRHPHITEVGLWLQDDSDNVNKQIIKFFGVEDAGAPEGSLAPFVPTPAAVVRKMIEVAEIQPNEHVVDLGAGDGRLLFAAVDAAEGVRAYGHETHTGRREALRTAMAEHPKADYLAVFDIDIRKADISGADVVFMYLLGSSNAQLKPKLLKEMKPGARVVSHDFAMPDWEPETVDSVKADGRMHAVYSWRIPAK